MHLPHKTHSPYKRRSHYRRRSPYRSKCKWSNSPTWRTVNTFPGQRQQLIQATHTVVDSAITCSKTTPPLISTCKSRTQKFMLPSSVVVRFATSCIAHKPTRQPSTNKQTVNQNKPTTQPSTNKHSVNQNGLWTAFQNR